VYLKKTISAAAFVGALGFGALGLGSGGVASAAPIFPAAPATPLPQDPGHGHGHGHGGDWGWDGGNWGGPWYGPGYWNGPGGWINACVSATGPWGYVTGSVCI
jgi:hypothetical protein